MPLLYVSTMSISENVTTFGGLPVVTVEGDQEGRATFPAQSGPVAWRATFDYHEGGTPEEVLSTWITCVPEPETVQALLLGVWPEPYENQTPVQALVAASDRFPALKHLFIAEVTFEENEISWIDLGDLTPVIEAWAGRLETLRVRGSQNLVIAPFTSETLTELAFENGGLPAGVPQALAASTLPALRHLEIWLGDEEYGYDTTTVDVEALLANPSFGAVRHLGLRNVGEPLEYLTVIAASPLLAQLTTLDLSLGVFGDECVDLLTSGAFSHLTKIDLSHHYFTGRGITALRAGLSGTELVLDDHQSLEDEGDDPENPYDGRWIAVSE